MAGKEDKHLPYNLENLSIPELEALLRKDFLASEDSAPDVDYTMAVVEVIQKKEQAQPDYQPLDTARAWEEFKTFFNTEEGRETSIYRSDEEDETACSNTEKQTSGHKKSKAFRRCDDCRQPLPVGGRDLHPCVWLPQHCANVGQLDRGTVWILYAVGNSFRPRFGAGGVC